MFYIECVSSSAGQMLDGLDPESALTLLVEFRQRVRHDDELVEEIPSLDGRSSSG